MHVLIGKRQIILSALVVMLGLAVFVNWYFTGTDTELMPEGAASSENSEEKTGKIELVNAEEGDYFASVRMQRASSRDETMEELRDVMAKNAQDSEAAVMVSAMINELSQAKQRETDIESLVLSTLGGECVAVISDNAVEIVVSRDGLSDESVLQISDIVNSVCGNDYENVRISTAIS